MRFLTLSRFAGLAMGGVLLIAMWPAAAVHASESNDGLRESQACLECHEDSGDALTGGPHAVQLVNEDTKVSCTDCHTGPSGHWEDDPDDYAMANLADLSVADAAKVCMACHIGPHAESQALLSAHATNNVNCLECHRVHGRTEEHQLKQQLPELCYSCHMEKRGDFAKTYHHPADERGFMTCADCHLSTDDSMAEFALQGSSAVCLKCHNEFQGPFPYDHQAAVDYSTDEGGCVSCHDPHGSYLPRMLKQPYEAPHYQLCSQCHVVPLHNYNSQHGSDWAGVSCSECHVDIHGSYTSRNYLTTALEAQGCFVAGCHSQ